MNTDTHAAAHMPVRMTHTLVQHLRKATGPSSWRAKALLRVHHISSCSICALARARTGLFLAHASTGSVRQKHGSATQRRDCLDDRAALPGNRTLRRRPLAFTEPPTAHHERPASLARVSGPVLRSVFETGTKRIWTSEVGSESLQDSEPTMGIVDHPYLDREYDVQGIVSLPARLCASN